MKIKKTKIGEKEVLPFTIPSGIVTTQVSSLEKLAKEIPELGVLTTKSIGPKPRVGNREPVLVQYYPGCFVNAVGLTNPGAEEFSERLTRANFPDNKFLLASIFGKNEKEFVYVAMTLENYVDGFELNLSCPHAKGYGMQLGQDPEIVFNITRAVKDVIRKPVFAKLTPNAGNIGEISLAAVTAGAEGIVAINTVGPGNHIIDGYSVLTNKVGGLSGRGILPIGVKCVKDIRDAVDVPIIGMGGIATAEDVESYFAAGASFFGIGSALVGMTDEEIKNYFSVFVKDLERGENNAESLLKQVDMEYQKVRITEKIDNGCDFKLFKTDTRIRAEPGQFVFAWLPYAGEKPFSVMDDDPLTLGILERGDFTRKINSLDKGDYFYFRGPYGKSVEVNGEVVLVGGGCGIAGLFLLAKRYSEKANLLTLLGGKDKQYIPYIDKFEKYGKVRIVTEDGSLGDKGLVTDLFKKVNMKRDSYFFNCGSKEMIDAVLPLELEVSSAERIYSSVDYMTKCGVGICGSCADEKGRRSCIEGPFMSL